MTDPVAADLRRTKISIIIYALLAASFLPITGNGLCTQGIPRQCRDCDDPRPSSSHVRPSLLCVIQRSGSRQALRSIAKSYQRWTAQGGGLDSTPEVCFLETSPLLRPAPTTMCIITPAKSPINPK
jgi:hypothetical protein